MSRPNEPWTVDRVTVRLLAALPSLADQVTEALEKTPSFMDVIGEIAPDTGAVETIRIHAWTPNKILVDIAFRNGWRYANEQLRIPGGIPQSLVAKILGEPCSHAVGHPCFDDQEWLDHSTEDDIATLRMKPLERLPLGLQPHITLRRLIDEELVTI